jgi:hypothetical protein
MAIQRDFYYEAGDLTITNAYHKISQVQFNYECGAQPSGHDGGGPDPSEADANIQYDVFANSGVRFSIATTLDGKGVKWPIENWPGVSGTDSLMQSAYGFLKTGELAGGTDV